MEPPSPLISWVNPFPSRFINRTLVSREKCHISVSLVCHREKNEVGWSRTQKPVLRPFSFFTIRPFLQFYSRWDLGIMKQKLTETEHEAMGQRQRAEDHGKVIFASVYFFFFFAVIHSTFKHAWWASGSVACNGCRQGFMVAWVCIAAPSRQKK